MRRALAFAVGAVASAAVATGAGCTFLVSFEERATDGGGGDPPDAVADVDADLGDARDADAAPPFPPACDTSFPLSQVNCGATFPRPNCATDTQVFPSYPASRANDLVLCDGGAHPTCVLHCPYGCAVMPNGFPDECDACHFRPDGTYCVKDLPGADPADEGVAADCRNGKTVAVYVCGANRCASTCPRTDHKPSCCN